MRRSQLTGSVRLRLQDLEREADGGGLFTIEVTYQAALAVKGRGRGWPDPRGPSAHGPRADDDR